MGGGGTRGAHGVVVQTQDGSHGARAHRHGGLHGVSAHAHEAHGVFERKRTRCGQRRILTQAVASHDVGLAAASGRPGSVERHAGRQHGRLRIRGQVKLFRRTLRDQGAQVLTQGLGSARHGVRDGSNA
ncbi:hypothetical protein D3C86_1293330 [compost metagenome]